jgi:hypothetical protein
MNREERVTTAETASPAEKATATDKKERNWAPRFWLGCDFFAWMRLLASNRFAVDWPLLYIAVIDTIFSVFNTCLRWMQTLIYGRRVTRTEIKQPPIFVIGHWRSGTTLLHELLVLDERFTYPTSYACFAPNHFMLTEPMADPWLGFLLPSHRPMDDMTIGWDSPQEDEFALCNLGVPSPYLTLAFPNHPPQCQEYLDFDGVSRPQIERWKHGLLKFLKQITYRTPKRIVLKSPPHTSRIPVLLEMFPDALFVHIVRNPYKVFASTVNMWKRMYEGQGLQKPKFEGLEEHVLSTYLRMHEKLEQTRGQVDPGRFYEIRYEELVRDPVGQLRRLYDHFQLGQFDDVAPKIEEYQAARAGYQTKRYQIAADERDIVTRRWGAYVEKYGYSIEPASV